MLKNPEPIHLVYAVQDSVKFNFVNKLCHLPVFLMFISHSKSPIQAAGSWWDTSLIVALTIKQSRVCHTSTNGQGQPQLPNCLEKLSHYCNLQETRCVV